MVEITQVEVHLTHACNLSCQSCTHFSNEGFTGRETPDSFRALLQPWSERFQTKNLLLLGGEPTLNPDLTELCGIARDLFPDDETRILLVTNGWFLHKHPKLADVLRARNIVLDVSLHHNGPEHLKKREQVVQWINDNGVTMRWRESIRDWLEYYTGVGKDARPFADGDPQSSWDNCPSRWCFTVRDDGLLCKCPMTAWLPMHVAKFGDGDGAWTPYVSYQGLRSDCTEQELEEFTSRKAEACCRMCPANPHPLVKPDPLIRLTLERVSKGV